RLDERRQRALSRYYLDAGCGGIAVGVHSTQFEIREPGIDLFHPVLELAAEEAKASLEARPRPFALIAGICGRTEQAIREAELAASLGYDAGLVSLTAFRDSPIEGMVDHLGRVGEVLPVIGFYLQPAVGGRFLPYRFWREVMDQASLLAVKMAPFNRYQTNDVVRALADSGRDDVALYTGNDDNIIADLLTPFSIASGSGRTVRIVGGLLGQWGVWTRKAVEVMDRIREVRKSDRIDSDWLRANARLTDANAAVFDAANGFAGVIPGILEVLRRQGLLEGIWCLNPEESLSPGQAEDLDRVCRQYPELTDDDFVRQNLSRWLS
ncbi:MAG: dihydrodipicolinate synthase family protein, partial [Opitutaceae bacterium]